MSEPASRLFRRLANIDDAEPKSPIDRAILAAARLRDGLGDDDTPPTPLPPPPLAAAELGDDGLYRGRFFFGEWKRRTRGL